MGVRENGDLLLAGQNDWWSTIPEAQRNMGFVGDHCILMADDTVLPYGGSIPQWERVVKISSSDRHAVGLLWDGTVVAADFEGGGGKHLDVDGWTNMVAVAAGHVIARDYVNGGGIPEDGIYYTVGLRSDGTLWLAMEGNGFVDAQNWRDVVSVCADGDVLIGLRADGTVKFTTHPTTRNDWKKLNERLSLTRDWTNIVQLDSSEGLVIGLKADGTVVTNESRADVSRWKDIVTVASSNDHLYGLKADGTVMELNVRRPNEAKETSKWHRYPGSQAGGSGRRFGAQRRL